MNDIYKKQVALLIRIMPSVYRIKDFAVHGGTAINLFHKNMPRYSVDIDLTYIPVKERAESLDAINNWCGCQRQPLARHGRNRRYDSRYAGTAVPRTVTVHHISIYSRTD